jgi:hypothetical protein
MSGDNGAFRFGPDGATERINKLAYHAICSLRDGEPLPSLLANGSAGLYTEYGRWANTVAALALAHTSGGTAAVESAYLLLLGEDPDLCTLMAACGDDHWLVKQLWSVARLYDADFPPQRFVVPGILPTGLSILAGRPKLGKSWLALQIACAVGAGGSVLGQQAVKGRVLYLALEDTPRRLRDRLQKLDVPRDAEIHFATDWAPFSLGGAKDLTQELGAGYNLVIVDTFSRAIGRADQMDATAMTLAMSQLHHIAAHDDVALLLVDHHRKSASPLGDADPIDDIFGSTAKAGVVDAALGLYRQHGKTEATLKVTGRDVMEQELALRWDPDHFSWICQGDAEAHERTQRQGEVLHALEGLGWTSLRDLSDATGQDRSNLHGRLQKLVEETAVERKEMRGRVFYRLACAGAAQGDFSDLDIPPGDEPQSESEVEDPNEGLFDYAD